MSEFWSSGYGTRITGMLCNTDGFNRILFIGNVVLLVK